MQKSKLLKGFKDEEKDSLELLNKFKELKEKTRALPRTRKVKLILLTDCNCGSTYRDPIERTVPYDSPLEDGDIVEEFNEETDKFIFEV